jgi:hypothetical protein
MPQADANYAAASLFRKTDLDDLITEATISDVITILAWLVLDLITMMETRRRNTNASTALSARS